MGGTGYGGIWVLFWWVGPCSVNLWSNFLLMGVAVFLPCSLAWGKTLAEVMATSFKRLYARSVVFSVPDCTVDPQLHQRLLDTHRQAWLCFLWGHWSSLLGPGVNKVLFVPSKSLFPQSCLSSGCSMVVLMVTSSKGAYATFRPAPPRAPAPEAGHWWPELPQETLRHSKAGLAQSLWGLLVHTRFHLSPLSVSGEYGVWF